MYSNNLSIAERSCAAFDKVVENGFGPVDNSNQSWVSAGSLLLRQFMIQQQELILLG
jgi:hypothetical protein